MIAGADIDDKLFVGVGKTQNSGTVIERERRREDRNPHRAVGLSEDLLEPIFDDVEFVCRVGGFDKIDFSVPDRIVRRT
ncbi:hypothetical protein [Nitrobacter sp.]|uniref:hypothetical protein n=1 Tax=Nitrobacter sp. TaxID=29420 RepID=UPI00399D67EB